MKVALELEGSAASIALIVLLALAAPSASAQAPADPLVDALQHGGHVLVMRHARAPRTAPAAADAAPGNTALERQLDATGRETAAAMGHALRRLEIPIGAVLSSPTFRALETARYLALGEAQPLAELGDGGAGMQPDSEGRRSEWLRAAAAQAPQSGSNVLMITHLPNLVGAFGDAAADMADGETLILQPDGERATVTARIRIEEWPADTGN